MIRINLVHLCEELPMNFERTEMPSPRQYSSSFEFNPSDYKILSNAFQRGTCSNDQLEFKDIFRELDSFAQGMQTATRLLENAYLKREGKLQNGENFGAEEGKHDGSTSPETGTQKNTLSENGGNTSEATNSVPAEKQPGIGSAVADGGISSPLSNRAGDHSGETPQAKELFDYFVQKGLSPAQAAGIVGNMETESSFSPAAYNPDEEAIGLCQWEGPRRSDLEQFAAQQGRSVTDWRVQADFVMKELNSSESGAFANLKNAGTAEDAAVVFQSQYERSAALTNRADNASRIFQQFA